MGEADPLPGRRERNKLERRRRIEVAARAVFQERGFERATTREIAERADVSSATLFAYATEKRELLLMLYRDDLWNLNDFAFETLPQDADLLVQLEHIFRPRYEYWSVHPDLSRRVIRELADEHDGAPEGAISREGFRNAFLALRERIAGLLIRHQNARRIAADVPAEDAARLIMHVYLNEQRVWIERPDAVVSDGVATLLHYLSVLLRGVIGESTR